MDQVRQFHRLFLRKAPASEIDTVEGPLLLDSRPLPSHVEQRIGALVSIFSDVVPRPLQDWCADFARDADPAVELAIWDKLVAFFVRFAGYDDVVGRKPEILHVLLDCAEESPTFSSIAAQYRHLTARDIVEIRRDWFGCN